MATELMTAEELAAYLKVNKQTVYRKYRCGELPGLKIGRALRFRREQVDRWLHVLSSLSEEKRREELFRWGEQFARERGITEKDVMEAVRAYRRSGR